MDKVLIFGKDDCPYTSGAKEDYTSRCIPFEHINVKKSKDGMKKMLEYSGGRREVPVIVDGKKITVGFGGGT